MIKCHNYKISGKSDIKIVLISDIHYYPKFKVSILNYLLDEINSQKPDYICIAGDLLDQSDFDDDVIYNFLVKLAKISKVILSLGNHDIFYKKKCKRYHYSNTKWLNKISKIKNLVLLNNTSYETKDIIFHEYNEKFNINNRKVIYNFDNFNKHINLNNYHIDLTKTNILLCHSPESVVRKNRLNDNVLIKNMDLIMCGHMHNGLVFTICEKIFKNYGFISPRLKLFPSNARGYFDFEKTKVIISGGITKFSDCSPKIFKAFNFLYNNDIDVIEIKK